ncbi:hypothetical protein AAVH_14964 [Aphelenchoides avenae]|nr:hypothetical protein AAVH_14964 [Aphelenchus avenae]
MEHTSTPASASAAKKRCRDEYNSVDCVKRSKSSLKQEVPSHAASSSPVLSNPAFDFEDDDLAVLSEVSPATRLHSASPYDMVVKETRLKREYELRLREALDEQEATLKEVFRKVMALQKRLYEERIADLEAAEHAKQMRLHAVKQAKREATTMVQEQSDRERQLLGVAEEKGRQLESLHKQLDSERESWKSEKEGLLRDVNGWKESAYEEHQKFLDYLSNVKKLKDAKKTLELKTDELRTELASLKED